MRDALPHIPQPDAKTWDGERLQLFGCPFGELSAHLPVVVRRPFRVPAATVQELTDEEFANEILGQLAADDAGQQSKAASLSTRNPYRDTIVRLPGSGLKEEVAIGVVSKRYRLVQHAELARLVAAGLEAANVEWQPLATTVRLTELGGRLHFTVHLPPRFRLPVGDALLDLTIECFNSVDGTWAMRAGMGWIRAICGNGLFFGNVAISMRRPHTAALRVEDVPAIVRSGFLEADAEAQMWRGAMQTTVTERKFIDWIDTTLAKEWGHTAAVRALHITRTGHDIVALGSPSKCRPSERMTTPGRRVPGSDPPNDNVFRVAQVLAWLANRTGEWTAAVQKRRQIPDLLVPLGLLPPAARSH